MSGKSKKFHYIYKTTNLINQKFYIGMHSTNNIEDGYIGSGKKLHYSISKYGKENHSFEILEFSTDRKSLSILEAHYVTEQLLNDPLCMNLKVGGEHDGCVLSEHTKIQMSISHTGKKHTLETRMKMSKTKSGKPKSEEHKRKLSIAHKGKMLSEEHKTNIGLATLANADKIYTEERNNKIRASKCKIWIVIDPNNTEYVVNNLIEFCKLHGLGCTTLKATLKRGKPAKSGATAGWMLRYY